jgi:hypothetical protein
MLNIIEYDQFSIDVFEYDIDGMPQFPFNKWLDGEPVIEVGRKYLDDLRRVQKELDVKHPHEDILKAPHVGYLDVYTTDDHLVKIFITRNSQALSYMFVHIIRDIHGVTKKFCEFSGIDPKDVRFMVGDLNDPYIAFIHLKPYPLPFMMHVHEMASTGVDVIGTLSGNTILRGSSHPAAKNFYEKTFDMKGLAVVTTKYFHTGATTSNDHFMLALSLNVPLESLQ